MTRSNAQELQQKRFQVITDSLSQTNLDKGDYLTLKDMAWAVGPTKFKNHFGGKAEILQKVLKQLSAVDPRLVFLPQGNKMAPLFVWDQNRAGDPSVTDLVENGIDQTFVREYMAPEVRAAYLESNPDQSARRERIIRSMALVDGLAARYDPEDFTRDLCREVKDTLKELLADC